MSGFDVTRRIFTFRVAPSQKHRIVMESVWKFTEAGKVAQPFVIDG